MSAKIFKMTRKSRLLDVLRDKESDPFSIKEGGFKYGQLKDSFYYTDWTEQSFLSDTGSKEMVSRSFSYSKLKYFVAAVLLAIFVIVGRSIWLQVVKNDYYSVLAEGNRLRAETIEPKRGIIYAKGLEPLVRNKANFVLYLRPIDLPKNELVRDDLIRQIGGILDNGQAPKSTLTNAVASSTGADGIDLVADQPTFYKIKEMLAGVKIGSLESYQPLFVADNIDYDKAMLLEIELPNWPGVFLTSKTRREYLLPSATSTPAILGENSLSHILGYTGKINDTEIKAMGKDYSLIDYIGKAGLEYSWEKELKGKAGAKNIEVDALGRQKKVINEIPAVDGSNLQLALDLELQEKTEEIVKSYLEKAGLHRASVIIMNPNNGEILTLLSLPAYDNNLFAKGISQTDYNKFLNDKDQPLFNRAISGEFPSGSTIKPIFAAGALQEKIITENTSVLSTGGLSIGEWFFPDWKAGGHGVTNVRKAIAESVNTFFYYIGGGYKDFKGLGLTGLVKYSRLFGLGELTGIDLHGERKGFVPTQAWKEETKNEPWYIGDTYHFSIGQGDVIVTPLQVANYTAAIANGGTLYEPHLVSKILDTNNNVVQDVAPVIIRSNFIDPDNLRIVREGMRQTITAGSARSLSIVPVAVAGKTGTAQWSTKKAPHAWFIGFAPYDKPELVITVLVEEGVEGSTIAAPIARDILNWYFTVHPEPAAASTN
ncbi:MAG: penicillin-binding protein 2 [Patescibacteria group bacterium]